jgi:hypothetical protein
MGTATQLGPFGAFIAVWTAMMLPGAAPAVLRRSQTGRREGERRREAPTTRSTGSAATTSTTTQMGFTAGC